MDHPVSAVSSLLLLVVLLIDLILGIADCRAADRACACTNRRSLKRATVGGANDASDHRAIQRTQSGPSLGVGTGAFAGSKVQHDGCRQERKERLFHG